MQVPKPTATVTPTPSLVLAASDGVLQLATDELGRAYAEEGRAKAEAARARLAQLAAEKQAAAAILDFRNESEALRVERSNAADAIRNERENAAEALQQARLDADHRVEERERAVHLTNLMGQGVIFGSSIVVFEVWSQMSATSHHEIAGLVFGGALVVNSVFHLAHSIVGARRRRAAA